MTQVPALREALQQAAQRRYGRRRRLPRVLVPCALVAALAVWIVLAPSSQPDRETVATPTATPTVHTVKTTPAPARGGPTGPPEIVKPTPLDAAKQLFRTEGGTRNGTLLQAWKTPGMQGERAHVFLFARGDQRCLSVPDPLGAAPGDRGVTCSSPEVFARFGVSLTIGPSYAAVVPGTHPAPVYRHADGTREPLTPVKGLVALINAEGGSAVALYDGNGRRRTDAFRVEEPRTLYTCSNGYGVELPMAQKPTEDPCTAMAARNRAPAAASEGRRR
jgi:hypothetical protein